MAERLPTGLIESNTAGVSTDIEQADRIDVEDLARLWRAYSTNKRFLANNLGWRLENLFWRVWGSTRIRENLRGSQLAAVFASISEADIIRTTPQPSPRTSRLIPQSGISGLQENISTPSQEPPLQLDAIQEVGSSPEKPEDSTPRGTLKDKKKSSKPAPILKKRGSDGGSKKKSAIIITPAWKTSAYDPDHDEPEESPTFSEEHRSSISSYDAEEEGETSPALLQTSPPGGGGSTGSNGSAGGNGHAGPKTKKVPSFTVGGSKRRPAGNRRKSSTSSSGSSKKQSPRIGGPSPKSTASTSKPLPEGRAASREVQKPRHASSSVSPVSTSPFRRLQRDDLPSSPRSGAASAAHHERRYTTSSASSTSPSSIPSPTTQRRLVDHNFRSAFMERMRSPTNRAAGGTKSAPKTALSTSFQATGSVLSELERFPPPKIVSSSAGASPRWPVSKAPGLTSVTEETGGGGGGSAAGGKRAVVAKGSSGPAVAEATAQQPALSPASVAGEDGVFGQVEEDAAEEGDPEAGIQRARSQLTLLLKEDQKARKRGKGKDAT